MPTEGSAPFSGLELDTSLGSITDTDILSYFMNDDTDLLNTYLSTNSSTSTSTSTSASTATSGCSYDASSSSSSSSSPSHTDSSPGSSPLHATPQSPLSADGGSTDLEASLESIVKQEPTENPLNLLPHSLLPSFPTIKSEAYSQKSVRNFKQEDQKCSNKKRSHSSSDSEDDDSCLSLSRDELLKLTSKGLEAFTQNLSTARGGLTQDEERQLKRQRRLIKNRESAQLSRMRKKIYIEDLERKVTGLTSVNEKLTQQVSALALQNKALRDEVAYLHSVIKQSNPQLPSAAATAAVGVVPPTLPLLAGRSLRQEQVHSALGASRGLKTAGVCLLIVLFSFGLFFNSISRGKGPTSAGMHRYTGRVLQSLPDEVDTPRLPAAAQPEQVRDAIEVFDDEPPKPSTSELIQPAQPAAAQPKLIGEKRALQDTSTPSRNVKKVKIQDDTNLLPATDDKDKEKEAHSLVSLSQRQQPENPEEDFLRGMNRTDVRGIHWRPNTRYLFCSDPQHVRSPEPISVEHEGSYPAVSFLLPSTAFNGSVSLNGYGENALVEINCQILGINVYPMYSISN